MRRFFAILMLLSLFSCRKYEDGPLISFRSREARLCGDWQMQWVEEDGVRYDADGFDRSWHWVFKKDGSFFKTDGSTRSDQGNWIFKAKGTYVRIDYTGAFEFGYNYRILELRNKRLSLELKVDDKVTRWGFEQN